MSLKFVSAAPLEEIRQYFRYHRHVRPRSDNLEATNGKITVDVESMNTGLNKRDAHMKRQKMVGFKNSLTIIFEIKGLGYSDYQS